MVSGDEAIITCTRCTHSWLPLPEATVSKLAVTSYSEQYQGYRDDPFQQSAFRRLLAGELSRLIPPPATVLDVGCGNGTFMKAVQEAGYSVRGIDISESGAAICRKRGLNAMAGDFLTHDFGQQFDLITMWDVLEHLSRPSAFLLRVRQLLSPTGRFAGKIPGFGRLSVNLSRRNCRVAAVMLGAPDHIQYFNPRSLAAMFSANQFQMAPLHGHDRLHGQPVGGTFRTRAVRKLRQGISAVSGDRNLFFVAHSN